MGKWNIAYDWEEKGINITQNDRLVYDNLYASYKLSDSLVSTRDYAKKEISSAPIDDGFGKGVLYKIVYKDTKLPELEQSFYVYPEKDYVLTEFTIDGEQQEV